MTFFVFETELASIISSLLQLTGYPIIILLYHYGLRQFANSASLVVQYIHDGDIL
jgi:hypothetical protein